VPAADGLRFVGRVGTGFTERDLANLKKTLAPLHTDESPFDARLSTQDAKGVTFVKPTLVGEVRYSEWTSDDRLRQPSWRGVRARKKPHEGGREKGSDASSKPRVASPSANSLSATPECPFTQNHST